MEAPLTTKGTGSAVCAFRTHEVAWSAVTATTVSGPSAGGHAEERPVDGGDDVALVLGATVVRGDVGPLDVDVQRLIRIEGRARQFRPRA